MRNKNLSIAANVLAESFRETRTIRVAIASLAGNPYVLNGEDLRPNSKDLKAISREIKKVAMNIMDDDREQKLWALKIGREAMIQNAG